jgi:hypothetical protein
MRMFDEQQQVIDLPGSPFLDQPALERQRVCVRNESQAPDL